MTKTPLPADNAPNTKEQPGTTVSQDHKGDARPKLPHERDESDDSQHSDPRGIMKQAYNDVQSGQEDTDLHGSQGRRQDAVPPNEASKD
jgi:hypothetical protein